MSHDTFVSRELSEDIYQRDKQLIRRGMLKLESVRDSEAIRDNVARFLVSFPTWELANEELCN